MEMDNSWKPENLLRSLLQLLILPAIAAIVGATWKDFGTFLQTLAEKLPPKLLLSISILCLLVPSAVATYLGCLLLIARRENERLSQRPHFYTIFGAKWKYWPKSKTFEQHPLCRCCPEPNPCQVFQHTKNEPESLSCPSKQNPRIDFALRDLQGNHLTIAEAVKRLATTEAPHGT